MASSPIYNARSLANNYELILLEANHISKNPSTAKLRKCFQTFDEITPMLGQYQRVIKMIRDEVYEAVYSREYTIAIEADSTSVDDTVTNGKPASIERIPHFVILNKIVDERNKRAEAAEEREQQSKVVIEDLNAKISVLNKHTDGLEAVIESQKERIQELKEAVVNEKQESTRLGKELQAQHEHMVNETRTFECSIQALNDELTQESTKVLELSRFKTCHDNVQDDFRDPSVFSSVPQKALFSAKEGKLRKDIAEGKTLEKQLLKLRNTCIDEFDEYLEQGVLEEMRENFTADNRERGVNGSSEAANTEERQRYETAFTNMIANIENELQQNELHLSVLKTDLDKINRIKRESHPKGKLVQISEFHKVLPTHGQEGNSVEDDESELLEVIKNASKDYQFLPQEQILSKYAITAFYSCNQGKTFHELPNVQQCRSCGQKTLVCPHKVTTERIFHLPLQCTHIKFSRPALQVPGTSKKDIPDAAIPSDPPKLVQSQKVYSRLWNDWAAREPLSTRRIPRFISEKYLVSLIEQFFASVISDDFNGDEDESVPLLESWHSFLNDRYQAPSVAYLVAKDVMEAIARTVPSNGFVQLFAECLCGKLDPATFRYYLILIRLVQAIQWSSMEDFSSFVNIVYPFMSIEDLEQFTMSYTSFSENKITGKLICEFFLCLILKQREPGFHEMESKLLNHSETSTGVMNDVVFFEAMAEISPLSSERLCHRLFAQSKSDTEASHVSITRLSQIASFLDLDQRTSLMEMEIRKKLEMA